VSVIGNRYSVFGELTVFGIRYSVVSNGYFLQKAEDFSIID